MAELFNPFGCRVTGEPALGQVPVQLRVEEGSASRVQVRAAQDAYSQFARRATFSHVPNPSERGILGDGSVYRISCVGNTTIYTSLAAAAAGAALAWSFQAARLGAELADERLQASQYREQIADERTTAGRRVLAVERTVNATYQGALNDAIQKQAGLQAAADRARRERDGMQHKLSDAEQRLADASPATLIEYARSLNNVFGQCSQRYAELAIRADGHATDAATCRAAWPVIPQTKESQ